MNSTLAIDLSRLFLSPVYVTPSGIDRVEFAYARHFLNTWPGDCLAVLPTPWGVRTFDRDRARGGLAVAEELWRENADPGQDKAYLAVKAWLQAPESAPRPRRDAAAPSPMRHAARGYLQLISRVGFTFGRSAPATLPRDSIYLNVGQFGLYVRAFVTWLNRRPDIRAIFMLHDVLPLERPEFFSATGLRTHRNALNATARHAKALIVPTRAAGESARRALREIGRDDIATLPAPLPVHPAFLATERDPDLDAHTYFVICGNIEPRKNHALLLAAWRDLIADDPQRAPKLVIVGMRRLMTEALARDLDDTGLRNHVVEVAGLGTPAVQRLMKGARALLMPSFAEGFGLPLIEALTSGTPVITSDIPAHREAAGPFATYLGAEDRAAWANAIRALARDDGAAAAHRRRVAGYQPRREADYFRDVEAFIASLR